MILVHMCYSNRPVLEALKRLNLTATHAQIASEARVPLMTVRRAMDRMTRAGIIRRVSGGRARVSVYEVINKNDDQ